MLRLRSCHLGIAALTALTLVLPPGLWSGLRWAQAAPQQSQAAQKPASSSSPQKPGDDGGWPRTYKLSNGGSAIVYQPQIASWENQQHIAFWAAVAYTAPGAKQAALGTVKAKADTQVSLDQRLVNFTPLQITDFNFPSLPRDQASAFVSAFRQALPSGQMQISLDRVLAGLNKSLIIAKRGEKEGIKADPPIIVASTKPAILVNFDGAPIWSPIQGLDLKYAVNTNWDVFQQVSKDIYYLRNNDTWLKAVSVNGPWVRANKLPDDFSKLPDDDNWKDVKANVPGKPIAASDVPVVFLSTTPAEIILLKGEPQYEPVKGTSLLWVSNTESDLFRMGKSGLFYYLVAGRWFSAPDLKGPWTFATPHLPEDFKKIPLDHPRSHVLASVPGTDQAAEAILLAQVPRTAKVNKKELKAPEVTYQGDPKFEPIQGTKLFRAVNTDKDIIKVGDPTYYMCYQGVWFVSSSPTGPWEVATSVPQEIYAIPASSPVYNVTYVTTEQDPDDEDEALVSYTAGYMWGMMAWGCCMWGTGWYYPPYYGGGIYYPCLPTYGCGAWYNPYTGAYGRAAAAYGPYGGVGAAARYNPTTGTYARGAAAYGPYNSRAFAQAYNPRTGTYAQTRQGSNVYGNWGSSYVQRGDNWAQTAHYTNYQTGRTTTGVRGSGGGGAIRTTGPGGSGGIARTGSGDIYAGRDGNIYQRNGSGSWEQVGGGRPTPRQVNPATAQQLNRDQAARYNGMQRTNANRSYQSYGGGRAAGSSYRPAPRAGGGGFRGGGRR
jgi:hypothetical protein